MIKNQYKTIIRCKDCSQDLTTKAQYYDRERNAIYCENCNYRKDGNEWPKKKRVK